MYLKVNCLMKPSAAAVFFVMVFLALAGCERKKEATPAADGKGSLSETLKNQQNGDLPFMSQTRLLATVGERDKPTGAFTGHEPSKPPSAAPDFQIVVSERGNAVAYKAIRDGKQIAVINGAAGKPFEAIESIVFSPDGRNYAYVAKNSDIWHLVSSAREEIMFHHIGEPVFSPDSRHIAFQASANEEWYIVLDNKQSEGGKYSYQQPVFSADSTKLAFIENIDANKGRLHITDRDFNNLQIVDAVNSKIVRSPDGKQVAVVAEMNGRQQLVQIAFDRPDAVTKGTVYDTVSNVAFSPDGVSLAYEAIRGKEHYLVLDGKEVRISADMGRLPVIRPDRKAVGMVLLEPVGMVYRQALISAAPEKGYHEIEAPVYSRDGAQHAYAARKGKEWFVVANGSEGPAFDRIVSPMFSPDGSRMVYRARKDGKRFVVIADSSGKTIRQHPAYEQVFPVMFSPDGTAVAYGAKDGVKLMWMVEKL